jgi:hypothetical protein
MLIQEDLPMRFSSPASRSCLVILLVPFVLASVLPERSCSQSLRDHPASSADPFVGRYAIRTGPENELHIDVQIWGQVFRPGQYSVPDRTDLVGLISYAGGPTEDAKLKKVQVLRPLAPGDRVQEVDLEAFLKSGDPLLIPRLAPGDVVVIPASRSRGLTRMAGLVSVLALVANVTLLAARS